MSVVLWVTMALPGHQCRHNLSSLPDALLFSHLRPMLTMGECVSAYSIYLHDTVLLSTAHGRLSTVNADALSNAQLRLV
jgi:hypothetical protein